MRKVEASLRRIVDAGNSPFHCPGFVVSVQRGQQAPRTLAVGTDGAGRALREDDVFPVCSATKLATSLSALRLVDRGLLGLDDELSLHIPDAAGAEPGVTIRSLLSHSSGLPLDTPGRLVTYDESLDTEALSRACLATDLETAPGERVHYSNVGYGLVAQIVERATGLPFADALQALVLDDLEAETWFGEASSRPPAVIADSRSAHVGTDIEPYNGPGWVSHAAPWRSLSTTAAGLLALGKAFRVDDPRWRNAGVAVEATRDQTGGLPGGWGGGDFLGYDFSGTITWSSCAWGLGPELKGSKSPHWSPRHAGAGSFGHIGSTGCLVWVDPDLDTAWAVMGTRSTDSGWLLRHSGAIGAALLASE